MENSKQYLDDLIDKYLSGEATQEERQLLARAYMNSAARQRITGANALHASRINKIGKDSWEQLIIRINQANTSHLISWPRIAILAAAVIALAIFGIWFYASQSTDRSETNHLNYTNDIAPGKNTATLTLANGKTIKLSDTKTGVVIDAGSLKYNDGAKIPDLIRDDVQMNTPLGGTYQITLPDGSRVWLNAASSIQFPSSFQGVKQRTITLKGEAYFEIEKDRNRPFIVKSKGQQVEVLGTHFNINSYADEGIIKTTLLEGSVRVNDVILLPNQQSTLASGKIKVTKADIKEVIAWKEGDFIFRNEDVESVMRKLARWYNIEVIYDGALPEDTFEGEISRYRNISQVLTVLQQTKGIHFKIEGRKVIVSK